MYFLKESLWMVKGGRKERGTGSSVSCPAETQVSRERTSALKTTRCWTGICKVVQRSYEVPPLHIEGRGFLYTPAGEEKDMSDREMFLERLKKAYAYSYNVHEMEEEHLKAVCDMHMEQGSYVLSRRNVMWQAMNHEYVYMFATDHLSKEQFEAFAAYVYEHGMEEVDLKNNHMSTVLSLAVVAESADKEALKALKHFHKHKEFRMGLDGWMDFHTVLVDLEHDKVVTNMSGHDLRKPYKKFLKRMRTVQKKTEGVCTGAEQPAGCHTEAA